MPYLVRNPAVSESCCVQSQQVNASEEANLSSPPVYIQDWLTVGKEDLSPSRGVAHLPFPSSRFLKITPPRGPRLMLCPDHLINVYSELPEPQLRALMCNLAPCLINQHLNEMSLCQQQPDPSQLESFLQTQLVNWQRPFHSQAK